MYNDKTKAKHHGKFSNLIYEGHLNDSGNYNGRWYFVGFENSKEYSGKFNM